MIVTLRLDGSRVTVRSSARGGESMSRRVGGTRASTRQAVLDLAAMRARPGDSSRPFWGAPSRGLDELLRTVGRRLSADFLAGPVGAAIAERVAASETSGEQIELALEVSEELGDLPWETLILPRADGLVPDAGGMPLALHPNIAVYRSSQGARRAPDHKVRGPLRILVAIGSPESQDLNGELLNYEAELARIVAGVQGARQRGGAYVRVLQRGTLAAIHDALREEPEGFHVLHLSCHAGPGRLILEDDEGLEDVVSAQRLLDEGVPKGTGLPLVVLAGCSTGSAERRAVPDSRRNVGTSEELLASFAIELSNRGVPLVLAMQAPVSDGYAIDLAAELYSDLATAEVPDVLTALTRARQECERSRQRLPETSPRRGLAEWATPSLFVRGPRVPLYSRREPFGPVNPTPETAFAEGFVVRGVGEFVGRRREQRQGRRVLRGPDAGLVIHGIGGVGKSTLAAELAREHHPSTTLVAPLTGTLSIDGIFDSVAGRLVAGFDDRSFGVADTLSRAVQLRNRVVAWSERWDIVAEVLAVVPMLVILDNFEDNLMERRASGLSETPS